MLNAKKDTSLFPLMQPAADPARGMRMSSQNPLVDHDDRIE
jgi:hypothetical protein